VRKKKRWPKRGGGGRRPVSTENIGEEADTDRNLLIFVGSGRLRESTERSLWERGRGKGGKTPALLEVLGKRSTPYGYAPEENRPSTCISIKRGKKLRKKKK